jgi:hypothetical protein
MAVLLALDNVSYNAFTSGDSIIPYRKGKFGKYHVDGDVLCWLHLRSWSHF